MWNLPYMDLIHWCIYIKVQFLHFWVSLTISCGLKSLHLYKYNASWVQTRSDWVKESNCGHPSLPSLVMSNFGKVQVHHSCENVSLYRDTVMITLGWSFNLSILHLILSLWDWLISYLIFIRSIWSTPL